MTAGFYSKQLRCQIQMKFFYKKMLIFTHYCEIYVIRICQKKFECKIFIFVEITADLRFDMRYNWKVAFFCVFLSYAPLFMLNTVQICRNNLSVTWAIRFDHLWREKEVWLTSGRLKNSLNMLKLVVLLFKSFQSFYSGLFF